MDAEKQVLKENGHRREQNHLKVIKNKTSSHTPPNGHNGRYFTIFKVFENLTDIHDLIGIIIAQIDSITPR